MTPTRFEAITRRYPSLQLAVVGDICLDRYLEIDPARAERSIETGLAVHNVVRVRSQPGAAGTILNNLIALGVGELRPVGFCGEDGEGFELRRALEKSPSVRLDHFLTSSERRTFTYCKPLLLHPGRAPEELSRLDSKNWSPTPASVQGHLAAATRSLAARADAIIVMDQVDVAETGVVTRSLLQELASIAERYPARLIVADSRRSLRDYPAVTLKMNAAELAALMGESRPLSLDEIRTSAAALAGRHGRDVYITAAERGIIGATPQGAVEHAPALPVREAIDIVGAGDAVTANLTTALAAGATPREAIELASAAASIVIHQLGTTGTATVAQIAEVLFGGVAT